MRVLFVYTTCVSAVAMLAECGRASLTRTKKTESVLGVIRWYNLSEQSECCRGRLSVFRVGSVEQEHSAAVAQIQQQFVKNFASPVVWRKTFQVCVSFAARSPRAG